MIDTTWSYVHLCKDLVPCLLISMQSQLILKKLSSATRRLERLLRYVDHVDIAYGVSEQGSPSIASEPDFECIAG